MSDSLQAPHAFKKRLTLTVRDRKLEKLRSTGYDGTPEEWSSILHHALYPSISVLDTLPEKLRDTLNVTCVISGQGEKSNLNIIIRQSVEGITHKFGALQLTFSDNTDDVDLFGWAVEIADERDSLAARLRSSNTGVENAEKTIRSLQQQLQELIAAKEEHETQLLSKFALLLNEKKLRIRSQQRLIADQHAQPVSRSTGKTKNTEKRKAPDQATTDDASESEGFDAMDVDQDDVVHAEDSNGGRTPSTDTDSASDHEAPATSLSTSAKVSPSDVATIPPPRELPFGTTSKFARDVSHAKPAKMQASENEETASEDDEL